MYSMQEECGWSHFLIFFSLNSCKYKSSYSKYPESYTLVVIKCKAYISEMHALGFCS